MIPCLPLTSLAALSIMPLNGLHRAEKIRPIVALLPWGARLELHTTQRGGFLFRFFSVVRAWIDRNFKGVVLISAAYFVIKIFLSVGLNDLMESKGGKKKSSSSKSLFYEAPLGYSIEDVRPHGGIKKFRSAAYSNCARKPS
ncbi:hypothetical protein F0562_005221 [Nyssa sinensis]|uniref:Uncharacterized protein n=1 Tax=Nyssa sinensis TaxID=561372 RepID=A0A5J5AL23_9ASTE|nr:hypothetical protein F0562_005221 [Nyssa sinensis]